MPSGGLAKVAGEFAGEVPHRLLLYLIGSQSMPRLLPAFGIKGNGGAKAFPVSHGHAGIAAQEGFEFGAIRLNPASDKEGNMLLKIGYIVGGMSHISFLCFGGVPRSPIKGLFLISSALSPLPSLRCSLA